MLFYLKSKPKEKKFHRMKKRAHDLQLLCGPPPTQKTTLGLPSKRCVCVCVCVSLSLSLSLSTWSSLDAATTHSQMNCQPSKNKNPRPERTKNKPPKKKESSPALEEATTAPPPPPQQRPFSSVLFPLLSVSRCCHSSRLLTSTRAALAPPKPLPLPLLPDVKSQTILPCSPTK